jgi:cyanate lyase
MAGVITGANLLLMRRQACTELILAAKRNKGKKWEEIANSIRRSPVWVQLNSLTVNFNCQLTTNYYYARLHLQFWVITQWMRSQRRNLSTCWE